MIWIVEHPMLTKEILFKPLLEWIKSAWQGRELVVSSERPAGSVERVMETPELETPNGTLTVANVVELAAARKVLQRAVNMAFLERGVDVLDLDSAFIHPDTVIGEGTVIYPHVVIRDHVTIGKNCSIGPFAYLRPHCSIGDGVKIGDFVEIKNSAVGDRTSVGHLTYVGDSDVGARVNFGCGTVTVNYDGVNKHRTVVKDGAFLGCNTNLVAPVTVGENAYTAAGSTITRDVPDDALAIARARQVEKNDWLSPKKKKQ